MKKAAVIFAAGCEEGEALTIVDIFRRAQLECAMIGLDADRITGAHGITMRMDAVLDDSLAQFDMVVLPGGYGGAAAMRESGLLISLLRQMDQEGKMIAAICAAPTVLDKAGLLEGRSFTCYPTTAPSIHSGNYLNQIIVVDGNLITSQGPATAYAFAYRLVSLAGADALAVQNRMVYFNAFDETAAVPAGIPGPLPEQPVKGRRAAVLMIEGYEESETVQIVDLLRRAEIETHTFRFQEDPFVLSMQGMYVEADKVFSDEIKEYDVVIVPGGRTAGAKLIASEPVMEMLRWFDRHEKLIGGMCSGTTVLHAAGVMKGKKVTGYTGYAEKLTDGIFCEDVAVFDRNLVTSQGPATPYPFSFKVMEALGIDPSPYKERLLYAAAGGR